MTEIIKNGKLASIRVIVIETSWGEYTLDVIYFLPTGGQYEAAEAEAAQLLEGVRDDLDLCDVKIKIDREPLAGFARFAADA